MGKQNPRKRLLSLSQNKKMLPQTNIEKKQRSNKKKSMTFCTQVGWNKGYLRVSLDFLSLPGLCVSLKSIVLYVQEHPKSIGIEVQEKIKVQYRSIGLKIAFSYILYTFIIFEVSHQKNQEIADFWPDSARIRKTLTKSRKFGNKNTIKSKFLGVWLQLNLADFDFLSG